MTVLLINFPIFITLKTGVVDHHGPSNVCNLSSGLVLVSGKQLENMANGNFAWFNSGRVTLYYTIYALHPTSYRNYSVKHACMYV
jgi:hypothetical protein